MALLSTPLRATSRGAAKLLIAGVLLSFAPVTSATAEQASSVPGTSRVLAGRLDAGFSHTCALLDDGGVRCRGLGVLGQWATAMPATSAMIPAKHRPTSARSTWALAVPPAR